MKAKDLCKQQNFDLAHFEKYIRSHEIKYKDGLAGITFDDADVPNIIYWYKNELKRLQEEAQSAREEEQRKKKALAEMLITSGFNFDGYKIKKYSGYISGDDCVTIPRNNFWGTTTVDKNLCGALVKIRRQAIKELKEAAYSLGCNAVIGVDFDYLTIDPQHASGLNAQITVYEPYVICVTANGNAVIIEKDEIAVPQTLEKPVVSMPQTNIQESKNCPCCGTSVKSDATFCFQCGSKLNP